MPTVPSIPFGVIKEISIRSNAPDLCAIGIDVAHGSLPNIRLTEVPIEVAQQFHVGQTLVLVAASSIDNSSKTAIERVMADDE